MRNIDGNVEKWEELSGCFPTCSALTIDPVTGL